MNLLVISNMAPSLKAPVAGIFVQNQVDELSVRGQQAKLTFLAIRSTDKGIVGLIKKYGLLLWSLVSQAIFSRTAYDVIHVHYFYPTILFALIYKFFRNPKAKIVVTFHGSDIYRYSPPKALYRFAAKFVDKAIFVSPGLKARFHRKSIDSTILSAGILPCFKPQNLAKEYDLIMLGSVDHNKGIDRLKAILEQLERPLRILVVGDGPLSDEVKGWQFGGHYLQQIGRMRPEDLVSLLNRTKYLLSLSRHESFGLVMTEAMACGTPVIATSTDGANSQVIDGHNGWIVPQTEQVISQACTIINKGLFAIDQQQYQQLSQNAIESASKHKLPYVVETLAQLYQNMHKLR